MAVRHPGQGGRANPRCIRLGLESPGAYQGREGQGVKGTVDGRVLRAWHGSEISAQGSDWVRRGLKLVLGFGNW